MINLDITWPERDKGVLLDKVKDTFASVYSPDDHIAVFIFPANEDNSHIMLNLLDSESNSVFKRTICFHTFRKITSLDYYEFTNINILYEYLLNIAELDCDEVYFLPIPNNKLTQEYLQDIMNVDIHDVENISLIKYLFYCVVGYPIFTRAAINRLKPFILWNDGTLFLSKEVQIQ